MPKRSGGVAVDFNQQPLAALPGIGPRVAEKFAARGLETLQDLWLWLPRGYEDRTALTPIRALQPGVAAQVQGRVEAVERGRQVGFYDYVAKFDRQGLIAALKEQTEIGRAA